MAKSKISLGKCHIALENMWIAFKYLYISNKLHSKRTLNDFNIFRPWNFCTLFYVPGYVLESSSLESMGIWIEFVSCCCVKIVEILIMLNCFIVLSRSTISFYFFAYSLYEFFLIYNFIYLAVLRLSCSMQTHVETCGILVPLDQTQALYIGSTQS